MKPSEVISYARRISNTSSTQVSDADALISLNLVYQDCYTQIKKKVNEAYFRQPYKDSLVQDQSKYAFLIPDATTVWFDRVAKLYIKWSDDSDFVNVPIKSEFDFDHDRDWYKDNQSQADAFAIIEKQAIHIFPKAPNGVTDGIKMTVDETPVDLIASWGDDTEANILIPRQYHKVLAKGLAVEFYDDRWLSNEKNDQLSDYYRLRKDMLWAMGERNQWNLEIRLPSTSHYE